MFVFVFVFCKSNKTGKMIVLRWTDISEKGNPLFVYSDFVGALTNQKA